MLNFIVSMQIIFYFKQISKDDIKKEKTKNMNKNFELKSLTKKFI